jgi:hypothetical protein
VRRAALGSPLFAAMRTSVRCEDEEYDQRTNEGCNDLAKGDAIARESRPKIQNPKEESAQERAGEAKREVAHEAVASALKGRDDASETAAVGVAA